MLPLVPSQIQVLQPRMPTRGTGMGHCSHLPWFGAESGVSIDSYQGIYFQSPLSNLLLKKKKMQVKKKIPT